MPPRITDSQRKAVLALLAQGFDREIVAAQVGVTPGQVSAVAAHVKMRTYEKHGVHDTVVEFTPPEGRERVYKLLEEISTASRIPQAESGLNRILMGVDAETDEEVFWNPSPADGAANPHMLILGESGFGKTYAICCLLTELAQQRTPSLVFDYGQGFAVESLPREFGEYAKPIELQASREGIAINPLQLFPSDIHGPVNVAQRVADTFQRVYSQIGVQQHAILRQAVLDVMIDAGIMPGEPSELGLLSASIRFLAGKAADLRGESKSPTASHSIVGGFTYLDDVCLQYLSGQRVVPELARNAKEWGPCVRDPTERTRTLAGTSGHRVSLMESHGVHRVSWAGPQALLRSPR